MKFLSNIFSLFTRERFDPYAEPVEPFVSTTAEANFQKVVTSQRAQAGNTYFNRTTGQAVEILSNSTGRQTYFQPVSEETQPVQHLDSRVFLLLYTDNYASLKPEVCQFAK